MLKAVIVAMSLLFVAPPALSAGKKAEAWEVYLITKENRTDRLRVPGGWLFKVTEHDTGETDLTFVPYVEEEEVLAKYPGDELLN